MTQELVEEIATANRQLLRTSATLIEAAEQLKQDRTRLIELLRQAKTTDKEGAANAS